MAKNRKTTSRDKTSRVAKAHVKYKRKHKRSKKLDITPSSRSGSRWRKRGKTQTCNMQVDVGKIHCCYLFWSRKLKRLYIGQATGQPLRRQRQHRRELVRGGAKKTKQMSDGIMIAIIGRFMNIVDALQFEYAWNRFLRQMRFPKRYPWSCPKQDALQKVHALFPAKMTANRALAYLEAVFADPHFKWTLPSLPVGHESRYRTYHVYLMPEASQAVTHEFSFLSAPIITSTATTATTTASTSTTTWRDVATGIVTTIIFHPNTSLVALQARWNCIVRLEKVSGKTIELDSSSIDDEMKLSKTNKNSSNEQDDGDDDHVTDEDNDQDDDDDVDNRRVSVSSASSSESESDDSSPSTSLPANDMDDTASDDD